MKAKTKKLGGRLREPEEASAGSGLSESGERLGRELRWRNRHGNGQARRRLHYGPFGPESVELSSAAQGYRSVSQIPYQGRPVARGGSGDWHLRYQLDDMRAESQRFYRDNGIYKAMVDRVVDVILGDGLTLQAKTGDSQADERLQKLWRAFWVEGRPEVRGLDDGSAVERMLLTHLFVDGDNLTIKDPKTKLVQIIEAERIASSRRQSLANQRIESGVELDRLGKPLAFYVQDYTAEGMVKSQVGRSTKAEDVEFLANRERISQTRGTPVQQCNFSMFHRLNDICDSEAAAWQVLSRLAVAFLREGAEQGATDTSEPDPDASDADLARRIHDLDYAIIFHGRPGDKIEGIGRNIPGANFTESVKTFMRLLGLPFGFSLEFTLLIWSDTNYSSGRASIKQVQRNCRKWLKMLKRAMAGIYQWKVEHWIRAGEIAQRDDIFKHEFYAQPYPFLDPQKEADAVEKRIVIGQSNWSREAKAEGKDDEELVTERAADLGRRAVMVKAHNEKYPEAPVTMRDFTGLKNDKARQPAEALEAAAVAD